MSHTPGPWTINYSTLGYPYQIFASGEDDTRPGKVGTRITRWGAISLPSSEEGLSNALLIAAAPDLLIVAKEAIDIIESEFGLKDLEDNFSQVQLGSELVMFYIKARDVIAKALGEKS